MAAILEVSGLKKSYKRSLKISFTYAIKFRNSSSYYVWLRDFDMACIVCDFK